MKKYTVAGLAVLLASSGTVSAALADDQNTVTEEQNVQDITEEEQEEGEAPPPEGAPIDTLTLDMALELALNENTSLLLLEDRLEQLESQMGGTENDYRDLKEDIEDLEDRMEDLREEQKETGNRTFQTRYQIQEQIEGLEDQLDPLEDSFRQMNSNKADLKYDKAKAEEGVKLSTTSMFVQLVNEQNQIDFLEKSIETEEKRVQDVKARYDIGVVSQDEFHKAQRELTRLQSQLDTAKAQMDNNRAVFALNIGVPNYPGVRLEAPAMEDIEAVNQETPTEELVENSFSMKKAKEALKLAKADREDIYEDEDATSYEREQADIDVEVAQRNIVQLEDQLTKAVNDAFTNVKNQYQAVMDARYELDYAKEDIKDLKTQHEIGLLSETEYELSQAQVDKAVNDYETAKQNYYTTVQQIESIRNGMIQQQQQQ